MRRPSPQLEPRQVIDIVLAACRHSRHEGAEALWTFGGEKLHRTVGDREHLEHLLGNDLFRPLVEWESLSLEEPQRLADSFRQVITVESPVAGGARYLVAMRRSRHGEYEGCWLLSGIERE